mgnify:CR=1 FL=1
MHHLLTSLTILLGSALAAPSHSLGHAKSGKWRLSQAEVDIGKECTYPNMSPKCHEDLLFLLTPQHDRSGTVLMLIYC